MTENLIVDLVRLIASVVGMTHGTKDPNDHIVPSMVDQLVVKAQELIVFVLGSIVRDEHQCACMGCGVGAVLYSTKLKIQLRAQSVCPFLEAALDGVNIIPATPGEVLGEEWD